MLSFTKEGWQKLTMVLPYSTEKPKKLRLREFLVSRYFMKVVELGCDFVGTATFNVYNLNHNNK